MESTAAQIEIRLLGTFQVIVGGRPIPNAAWRRKRAADVVKLLALEPAHRLHREQIVETLWPELDPDATANNLRVVLHRARERLESEGGRRGAFLVRDGESVILSSLGTPVVDVEVFERAVAAAWRSDDPADSERALDLYGGELLPQDPYEDWIESRRAALRASYLTLLARTAQTYEERGELGKAIAAWERAVAAEPMAEERHVALIRLLALTGQRRQAMARVVHLVRTLKREIGAEPQRATRELALAIRDGRFPETVRPLEPARPSPEPAPDAHLTGIVTVLFAVPASRTADDKATSRFEALARSLIAERGGQLLESGDAAMRALFPLASSAIEAAVALQRTLAAESGATAAAAARIALHSIEVTPGSDQETRFGVANALLAAGHDGQILLSRTTAELVQEAPPAGISLRDLGEHRLVETARAQRVYQLAGSGLRPDFPPLRTSQGRRRSLPAPTERIIGRDRELAELAHLLGTKRLVTLTGPGGVGKTRLALTVADEAVEPFPDGVALAELAPLRAPGLIVPAIAAALGVQESGELPLLDDIVASIGDDRVLLVVDNCEHLDGVAGTLSALLARCPRLSILATSRARLRIKGEQEYPVSPLALPGDEGAPGAALPAMAGPSAAVALFVERASAARPDFTLTPENAPQIAHVVRRLDGLPLAIELAAARVRMLSPAELVARLARPLDVLTGGPRDAPTRQQTLRATITWSFDLLAPEEQMLFRRLAVFAGGFMAEAAEWVAGWPVGQVAGEPTSDSPTTLPPRDPATLDLLASLVDQSLVVARPGAGEERRFGMLETIREFALEQLQGAEEEPAAREAHAAHYLDVAERAREGFQGADQAGWLARIDSEHDNLRAALTWLLRSGKSEQALRMAAALWWFWWVRGHLSEGRGWLEQALRESDAAPGTLRARALHGAGSLAEAQGDYDRALVLHEEALAASHAAGDQEGAADALTSLGQIARDRGEYDRAVALFDEALVICRTAGDRRGAAYVLIELGTVASYRGGGALALSLYTEGLELLRPLEDQRAYAAALMNVATMTFVQGDPERAAPIYEEALGLWTALGDRQGCAMALANLGEIAQHRGELKRAVAFYEEALPIYQELGDRRELAGVLANLGLVARERSEPQQAAALLAGSLEISRTLGDREAIARALESLGGLAVAIGEPEGGARLLGRAESLRDEIGAPLPVIAEPRYMADLATVRGLLPAEIFAAAWAAGRDLPLEEALAQATALAPGAASTEATAVGSGSDELGRLLEE